MFARPVDSAIVAARAPWSTKCSVVTNVTAAERGSASSLLRASLSVAATPPPLEVAATPADGRPLRGCSRVSSSRRAGARRVRGGRRPQVVVGASSASAGPGLPGLAGGKILGGVSREEYLLADQPSELERLQLQSRVWEPSGRQLLSKIGDGSGGRALD